MLIINIPYKKLRKRAKELNKTHAYSLRQAFDWENTDEGYDFWLSVSLSNWDEAKKLQPHLFDDAVDYRGILKEVLANNDVSRINLSETAQIELQKIAGEIVSESANT